MISSTRSRESASRSSRNEASGVTSLSSTPSRSAVISWILVSISSRSKPSLLYKPCDKLQRPLAGTQRVVYLQNTLVHSHPTVHGYRLPGDVPCLLGHQERDDLCNLLRFAEPPGRNLLPYLLLHLLRQAPGELRLDVPGCHRVDRDTALRNLPRHALGEPDYPRLRRRVVGLPSVPHEPDDGAHVHDPAPPRPDHRPQSGACAKVRAPEVGPQDVVELSLVHPHHEVVPRDARVVD